MRDLYQRLDLPPQASQQQLDQAVSHCRHRRLKQDAEAVLLVPDRRARYDAMRTTVWQISTLRNRLGLDHGAHWQGKMAVDFTPQTGATKRCQASLGKRTEAALLHAERWPHWRIHGLLITLLMTGIGIGALIAMHLR